MEDSKRLRIACRLVCTDQWMVTHVDPSWPVSQLKRFLLQKFSRESTTVDKTKRSIPVSPWKARRRSLSPITFAAPLRKPRFVAAEQPESTSGDEVEQTEDLEDDAYFEEGEDDADADVNQTLAEAHRYKYDARPSTSSASDTRLLPDDSSEFTQEATAYTLIAFSTTQILEDRFSLEWYGTRPDELLELHSPSRCLVSLPRFSLDEYITPYFAAKVWALRLAGNTLEGTIRSLLVPSDHQAEDEFADASPRSPMVRDKGKKKINLEWKERWAIVHQGVLSLCKERHDSHTTSSSPLSSMLCIKDGSQLSVPLRSSRRTGSQASTNVSNLPSEVICLKFADVSPRQRTMSSDSHTPFDRNPSDTEGAVPPGAWWRRGGRDTQGSLSSSLASSASALIGSPSGAGLADMWDVLARRGSRTGLEDMQDEGEDSIWIVIDMLSSAACTHLLRVLHREAPSSCDSSFLPPPSPAPSPPSPIVFSRRTPSPVSSSDPLTPGPRSTFTFPIAPSPPLSPSTGTSSPFGGLTQNTEDTYRFPGSSSAPNVPGRPSTPARPPRLRINTYVCDHGVPYPDWRLALVRKARRAGLGAVGRAMELVMFGNEEDEDDDDDEDELAIQWARRASAMEPSPFDTIARPHSRPRSVRHASDPVISSVAMPSPAGEFDSPHPNRLLHDDSEESEMEWDGWLDVTVMNRRRERVQATRTIERTETLETAVPGDLNWGPEWASRLGLGTSSTAASTPDFERENTWRFPHSREQSGSEADGDTEGDGSSVHSKDPPSRPRPNSYYGYQQLANSGTRGRRLKRAAALEHGGRTLSSYSSADSLLKRTIRTAIGSTVRSRRGSPSASASSSEMNLDLSAELPPPRSASVSPPPSRPSLHSVASSRSHPLSPLCGQFQDKQDREGLHTTYHPIPLPDMPVVPSGYATFRHSALYGRGSRITSSRGSTPGVEDEEKHHAGLAHGESMQRLPVPMSMMMTTVSSTVSVGTGESRGKFR
ncbi:hypothetical protein PYCCODRAFT_854767 [Trametes coccinea BRFM310]|uniref:Uncharacterized protein n=1 Tax=Trametes coccinea (strain BRFM310) TaxID=1353009 RepID=A0A1Y2IDS7_TRAC3|nr:hypothetical protein PYCCODRAFT_854767 [Trametes coccinea BRFM310]